MRILLWHVHGSWTNALVRGSHDYLLPVTPGRDADGLGRARTWDWPPSVVEVPVSRLGEADVDVVVLQRPHELELAEHWLRRRPGADLPAVYVEHNTPRGDAPCTRHPMADRDDLTVVHVTHFNQLMWDCGGTPTVVIEHGVVDPGYRYTGELERAAVVVNEPVRRGRVTGTDLLPSFAAAAPLDVFGMQVAALPAHFGGTARIEAYEDLPQDRLHDELPRRRVYLHPVRWTSLGLSLIEAMTLGMPVVALGTTAVHEAVPPDAGVVSTRVSDLVEALRWLTAEPAWAAKLGGVGRSWALEHYGAARFLADWDRLLADAGKGDRL